MSFHARAIDRVRFDHPISVLAAFLDVPLVEVSLVRADRRFLTNRIAPSGWPAEAAASFQRLLRDEVESRAQALVSGNAREHPALTRYEVVPEFGLLAVAGVPLISRDGECLGSLGVGDQRSRAWSEEEIDLLQTMASSITTTLELQHERERREALEERVVEARRGIEAERRARRAFLMALSHEMRTPLNSMIRFSDLLLRGQLTDRQAELVGRVRGGTRNLLDLVNDLLDVTRAEGGEISLALDEVDVADVVRVVTRKLSGGATTGRPKLRTSLPSVPAPVRTDRARLGQIVTNVVAHALRFTPRGEVRVALHTDPDSGAPTRIEVRDAGPGLDPDQLDVLFAPFEQPGPDPRERQEGSALGLTLSLSLAELMGLRIRVESEPGAGTLFTIEFPGGAGWAGGPSEAAAGGSGAGEADARRSEETRERAQAPGAEDDRDRAEAAGGEEGRQDTADPDGEDDAGAGGGAAGPVFRPEARGGEAASSEGLG